jgi:hypothetical protein
VPVVSKTIRMNTIISGYYIKIVSSSLPKVLIRIVSKTDPDESIPKWLIEELIFTYSKSCVENLVNALKKKKKNCINM